MKKELWKSIPNYPDYQVSNLGRVKSLKGKIERILKPTTNKKYLRVNLYKNNIRKTFMVHQLVMMAFEDFVPCGHNIVIDHINNNKTDNRVENLQITNVRHNTSKDRKGGTSKYVGVSWSNHHKKWWSQIWINGKTKHIGFFTDELEASNAYQEALKNNKLL